MANVKQGNMTAPNQRWKHLDWWRRVFWKRERQAVRVEIADQLEDDYSHEEFMADICTETEPCSFCLARRWRAPTPTQEGQTP